MDDVATAAGVGRATVYRYFASREALLDALLTRALTEVSERLAQAKLESVPVEEAVARIVRALVAVGDRYMVLVREEECLDKEVVEREVGGPVRAIFERGRASGVLRTDLSPDWLEELLGGLIAAGLKFAGEREFGVEETSAAIVSLFLDGARTR